MAEPRKPYSELLRDPRWQEKRLRIMERDGFACARCGDKDTTLNVHHHFYIRGRNPWEYDNNDLVTLCEPCHENIEADLHVLHVLVNRMPFSSIGKLIMCGFQMLDEKTDVDSLKIAENDAKIKESVASVFPEEYHRRRRELKELLAGSNFSESCSILAELQSMEAPYQEQIREIEQQFSLPKTLKLIG